MRSGNVLGAGTIDRDAVMAILYQVPDPEIPAVSVVDLGIVRAVEAMPPAVVITPTYTGCPATHAIEASIRAALDAGGFGDVAIRTRIAPPWSTAMISPAGHTALRAYGIAPPTPRRDDPVECPRCASTDTREVSRFGSTPCKAQWRCLSCLEPFDRFKCH